MINTRLHCPQRQAFGSEIFSENTEGREKPSPIGKKVESFPDSSDVKVKSLHGAEKAQTTVKPKSVPLKAKIKAVASAAYLRILAPAGYFVKETSKTVAKFGALGAVVFAADSALLNTLGALSLKPDDVAEVSKRTSLAKAHEFSHNADLVGARQSFVRKFVELQSDDLDYLSGVNDSLVRQDSIKSGYKVKSPLKSPGQKFGVPALLAKENLQHTQDSVLQVLSDKQDSVNSAIKRQIDSVKTAAKHVR